MAKKAPKKNDRDTQLATLLQTMNDSGLPVQVGGEYEIQAVSSGIMSFDLSTGVGGFPRGRVSVVQGEEGSGKTLLALSAIAQSQQQGGKAFFIDLEHALTPSFAELLGVAYADLVVSRPSTLNEAYDVTRALLASGLFDVGCFDSTVALATIAELERSAKEAGQRAGKAQVHAEELPKVTSLLTTSQTAFIMISQLRENPNPPSWMRGGKVLYSPGGRAIKHFSSLTVDVSMAKPYKHGNQRIGHRTKTYIRKNKVAQPYMRSEFDMMYATGVDLLAEMMTHAIRVGVIRKQSSWFYFSGSDPATGEEFEHRWNGRAAVDEAFKEDKDLQATLHRVMAEAEIDPSDMESTTEAGSWEEIDEGDD